MDRETRCRRVRYHRTLDLPKLFRASRITALGLRLAVTSSVCMFVLLGAFLLWFSQLGNDTKLLMVVFVIAASVVLIALGMKTDAATKKGFLGLRDALHKIVKGNHNAKAPEEDNELGSVGELVNLLATQIARSQHLVEQRETQLKTFKDDDKSSQFKSLFLANMSEDLQITLNHVIGLCEMLGLTELDEEQQCIAEHVQKACTALVDRLGKLSDFEALRSGCITLADVEFDLHTAIKATVANQAFGAEKKGVRLACTIDAGVPERCIGDDRRIRQILLNFIQNAVNHTDEGEITIGAAVDEDASSHVIVRMDVSDTGAGMSREQASGVFKDPVERGSSENNGSGGGLGLAICRDLAEMMGGRVGVRTKQGQGSTFWFTVRLGKCTSVRKAPPPRAALPELATHGLPILLVTPKPENAAEIFVALQKAGFRVNVALSRVQFLDAIKTEVYGAAVVDGERPELIATVATWTRVEDAEPVPVIGLPYHTSSDGTKRVDFDQLQQSLAPLLTTEARSVNNP
jgi:signal transduction histidine kinase